MAFSLEVNAGVSCMLPVLVVTVLSMVVIPSAVMVTVPEVAEMGWLVSSPAAESRTTLPAVEVINSVTETEEGSESFECFLQS